MRMATPVWLRRPMPETESLATFGLLVTGPQSNLLGEVFGRLHGLGQVGCAAP